MWVRVDDKFTRSRKVKRAGALLGPRGRARVIAVWLDAMSYCNGHLTDGFFPDEEMGDLPDNKPDEVFTAMAESSEQLGPLVHREDGGWRFHDYCEYQPSKADVQSKQRRDRERKRRSKDSAEIPLGIRAESTQEPLRTPDGFPSGSAIPGPTGPSEPTDQPQEDQKPGASRPDAPAPRMARMTIEAPVAISDRLAHLRAAVHRCVESGDPAYLDPITGPTAICDALKDLASRHLGVEYRYTRELMAIVEEVLVVRAKRSA